MRLKKEQGHIIQGVIGQRPSNTFDRTHNEKTSFMSLYLCS